MFDIAFLSDEAFDEPLYGGVRCRRALITLGEDREIFVVPLSLWRESDYEQQWLSGIRRLVRGERFSCLITKIFDSAIRVVGEWWLLQSRGPDVELVNALLHVRFIDGEFDLCDPYRFVAKQLLDEGDSREVEPPATWIVPISDLEDFLARKQRMRFSK